MLGLNSEQIEKIKNHFANSEDFQGRAKITRETFEKLFQEYFNSSDPFEKAELNIKIEAILFPIWDEIMDLVFQEQINNFANFAPVPIQSLDEIMKNGLDKKYDFSKYDLPPLIPQIKK